MRPPLFRRVFGILAIATLVPLQHARAHCPRSAGEQTRRIVTAAVFLPAAPFVLSHRSRTVPMPVTGSVVRVSRRGADGDSQFLHGTLLSLDSASIMLGGAEAAPTRIPMDSVRCLQVPRRSRATGAATGFTLGAASGVATAGVIALTSSSEGERREALSFGTFALGTIGGASGALIGAIVRATAWDTALDRTR